MHPSTVAKESSTPEFGKLERLPDGARYLWRHFGLLLSVGLAITVCLLQNLRHESALTTLAYDSGHYLGTAQLLVGVWFGQLQHLSAAQIFSKFAVDISQLPSMLLLDGPLVPFLGAIVFAILGYFPNGAHWQIIVGIETAFQTVATALVYLCAWQLSRRRLVSTVAALLWAIYPAAILGCNSFLSEVPIACFSLATVFSLAKLAQSRNAGGKVGFVGWAFVGGFCAALVFVTKPALIAALAACFAAYFFFVGCRRLLPTIMLIGIGASLIVLPWAGWTRLETGQVYLSAKRVPTLNIVKGSDPTTDGWNTLPSSDYAARFQESLGAPKALAQIWRERPQESLNLALRKIERLWTFPWNDFRREFLGLPIGVQTWWHRLLFMLGLCGLMAFVARRQTDVAANIVGWSSVGIVIGHFAYIPFETLSRYGFTAMPFLVIMAGYALHVSLSERRGRNLMLLMVAAAGVYILNVVSIMPWILAVVASSSMACQLECALRALAVGALSVLALKLWGAPGIAAAAATSVRTLKSKRLQPAPLAFVFIVAGIVLCGLFAHLTHAQEFREWRCTLKPGQSAQRTINIKRAGAAWALLLIDGEQNLANAEVSVNGRVLSGVPVSHFIYEVVHYYLYGYIQQIAALNSRDTENMRQWRALIVPLEYLSDGDNEIRLRPRGNDKVTIYGAYPPVGGNLVTLPALNCLSPSKILKNLDKLETRVAEQRYTLAYKKDSLMSVAGRAQVDDLANEPGRQPGQYRMYLALGYGPAGELPVGTTMVGQSVDLGKSSSLVVSAPLLYTLPLNPALQQAEHLRLRFSGQYKAQNDRSQLAVTLTGIGRKADEGPILAPGTPYAFQAGPDWRTVDIVSDLPVYALDHGLAGLKISLASGSGAILMRNCRLAVQPIILPSFRGHSIKLH